MNDFAAFLAHIGPKPSQLHSLDRIDNDKNYEPGNVRWATRSEQQQNKKTTRTVIINGTEVAVAYLAKQCGLNTNVLAKRIRLGWQVERAMATPKGKFTRRAAVSQTRSPI